MNRHFWRACDREAGFSLVELMVTIIIATVAFAALVPVFVQAEQKSSADRMRNLALNLAQDKIERVRSLSYSVITAANLHANGSNVGTQFGSASPTDKLNPVTNTIVPVNLDNNGSRQLIIHYGVRDATGTTDITAYKVVTVTVWWTGNPAPVKPVVLSTEVYGQYAGPQLIAPLVVSPSPDANDWITQKGLTSVAFSATVNSAQAGNTWGVSFVVSDPSGGLKSVALSGVKVTGTQWSATWTMTTVPDGYYIVSATAYAFNADGTAGVAGNTLTRDVRLERDPPGPVALTALAGDGSVNLSWDLLSSDEVVSYRVFRSDLPGQEVAPPIKEVDDLTNCYRDTSVVNGKTYYYKVIAVDVNGNLLSLSDPTVTERPAAPAAIPNPAYPPAVQVTSASYSAQSIPLMWSSAVGVAGYYVYRDGGADPVHYVKQPEATTWTDSDVDWGTTYAYTIRALSSVGVEGPIATVAVGLPKDVNGWVQVVMPATPMYTVSVQVVQKPFKSHTVWAEQLDSHGLVIAKFPATGTIAIPNLNVVKFATPLPFGQYRMVLDPLTSKVQKVGFKLSGDPADQVNVIFNL
jgi:type II secretory pathway pseudopilin PulG